MSRFRDLTVLITAAGNVYMPGTCACLKHNGERNIRLIGADLNNDPTILQMCDAYYSVPRGDDPAYIDALLGICSEENVDVLLPIMSVELNSLSEHWARFEQIGTIISVSPSDSLAVANDKLQLFDHMRAKGIRCAAYRSVSSIDELNDAARALGYPEKRVCIKTTAGSGSRGFRILDASISRYDLFLHEKPSASITTLDEMTDVLKDVTVFPRLMLMEYLPGEEYTVDLLADHGNVIYCCCRKALNMENSIMLDGVVVAHEEINQLCCEIVSSLQLDGNIGFDIREDSDGVPYVMECNPRITAGIPVFAAAGVNLPYLNVKRLVGEPLPECHLKYGTIVRRRWLEMYTDSGAAEL